MLMITAVIQPFRLEHVRIELLRAELLGMTVSECAGNGKNAKWVPSRFGGPDIPDILPKIKFEIAVPLDRRQDAIDAIVRGARLGKIGDGKIFVSHLERVISVGAGQQDENLPSLRWPPEAAE